jgi:two-component system, response regulator PdtaR
MCPDQPPCCYRLLLVDDDRPFSATLRLGLEAAGHLVTCTASVADTLEVLVHSRFDLAIIEESLTGGPCVDLAPMLRERFDLPVLILSRCDHHTRVARAIDEGALAYLLKPVSVTQLLPMIATALARNADLAALRKTCNQLQTALDQERDVSIATGIIIARMGLDRSEAFEFLRRAARSSRRKLADVARDLIGNHGAALKADALLP